MLPPIDVQRLATALPTSQGWGEVHHLPVVGSTNVEAAERALVWSPVVAELQTAGRGRLGREWHEVPSAGLAMSVLVPLTPSPGWLPLVAGLAVRSALAEVGVAARLNDLADQTQARTNKGGPIQPSRSGRLTLIAAAAGAAVLGVIDALSRLS